MHVVAPGAETCREEHLAQEWVHWLLVTLAEELGLLLILVLSFFLLGLEGELGNAVLGHKLIQRHHFVEFDFAKLGAHHSVKHLIEVDEAIIDHDAHLEDDSLDFNLSWRISIGDSLPDPGREPHKEVGHKLDRNLDYLVASSEQFPRLLEVIKVSLEALQRVVLFNVVLGELLDDHQDEQVQHDVGDEKDEEKEEDGCDA